MPSFLRVAIDSKTYDEPKPRIPVLTRKQSEQLLQHGTTFNCMQKERILGSVAFQIPSAFPKKENAVLGVPTTPTLMHPPKKGK